MINVVIADFSATQKPPLSASTLPSSLPPSDCESFEAIGSVANRIVQKFIPEEAAL